MQTIIISKLGEKDMNQSLPWTIRKYAIIETPILEK